MILKINTLQKKIGLGFILMIGLLAATIGITSLQINNINDTTDKLADQHHPSVIAASEIMNGVNRSIAAVRGLLLLQDGSFRTELNEIWDTEIPIALHRLTELSREWESNENLELLSRLQPLLGTLHNQQQEIAALAATNPGDASEMLESQVLNTNYEIRSLISGLTAEQERLTTLTLGQEDEQIRTLTNILWGLLVLSPIAGFILAWRTARAITGPINNAVSVSNDIAEGDLDTKVDVRGTREIETLGQALENMRLSLKQKTEDTRRYDWLTAGQNKLNNVMRGDQGIEELSNNIITFLTEYIDASVGALYLMDDSEQKLVLTGTHALSKNKAIDSFRMGEGLIGQVAADKSMVHITGLEEKHLNLKSTLIDAFPENLTAFPFLVDGEVLGVIEIAKIEVFDESYIEFLESNLENIGISINSAIARKKINDLLEETQIQSEELQQQQEELEQNNEELEEQSQNLKEQQEELQASNEELEEQAQMLEQKNKDLETARNEIERKAEQLEITSKYKSEFLANMSHELRTPLNSLLILASDLQKNKSGNLNDDEIESAEIIVKSGRDLLSLINEILDLSKIEAGKLDLNLKEVALDALSDNIHSKFRKLAQNKGIQFNIQIDEALPEAIFTDRQRLEQILMNLLSNALKFTDDGEISVGFYRNAGDHLNIEVSDTGIGIPKDKQEVIFEAFQQAESGTARKYGGTGLGLSISRELAQLLGGRIRVDSTPGKGSTFTIDIPFKTKEADTPVKEETKYEEDFTRSKQSRYINYPSIEDQRNEITDSDPRILIIEDDKEFARILSNRATEKGFKYIAASTGEDGLALAEQFQPTAIILDLELPGIDGNIVLKELKGDPELRHIPVHIISAFDKTLDPIKSGAIQYFTKPVDKEQLNNAFNRIEDFISRKMKTLLIIEDDESLRKSIVKLIGNGDVECLEASTGKEAIKSVNAHPIDCIVLDIGLPDMSGFDLISQLEKTHGIETPPIVVYTGKELTKKETQKLQEYAETVIIKGIKSEERLLDETALFLHRTVKNLPQDKQDIITSLYDKEIIFHEKKILLVDDDMRNVFALSKVLKEKGLEIIKADNGLVALQNLNDFPDVDLVLMDIMMPEMDGYECMQKIRAQKEFKELPIIALTAKAMKNDRQKCLDAGANDYITKPVEIERLLSLMRIWINN